MLIIIAAAGENNALGKDGDLLWHLPDDFKRFKKLTTGHPIIMGRKTFESLPKMLPGRKHIVITRKEDYHPKGVQIAHSLEKAISFVPSDQDSYIIGGGEIYNLALDIADKIELTRVHGTFEEADTFFPDIDEDNWKLEEKTSHPQDEKHKFSFDYLTYVRA
ncbi:dihydrofolate reductase [Flavimarina sp. Hel_I_48]|uniref:dihydrofolate reductase n=1 Tax=Flavimarina sp. Hel_I_48 TaxID=1392488 RepID=UPI0004DF0CB5|nr:dihydrofolate reductase [Flavimarina sp. Hel_I_48]